MNCDLFMKSLQSDVLNSTRHQSPLTVYIVICLKKDSSVVIVTVAGSFYVYALLLVLFQIFVSSANSSTAKLLAVQYFDKTTSVDKSRMGK